MPWSTFCTAIFCRSDPRSRSSSALHKQAGRRHGVGVSSGTCGLHLTMLAAGIGPGDEVITTPFSFVASANCILYVGAKPVSALDYFLELNTYQCTDPVNHPPSPSNPCELDGGRFPVELQANMPSPLRMLPAAGLDFGNVSVGKSSVPQTVTLLNDPVPNAPAPAPTAP